MVHRPLCAYPNHPVSDPLNDSRNPPCPGAPSQRDDPPVVRIPLPPAFPDVPGDTVATRERSITRVSASA